MSDTYTDRATQALAHARTRALQMGQPSIATEHILLGLLDEGTGVGYAVLVASGQRADDLRDFTLHCARRDKAIDNDDELPFSEHAQMLLECAKAESEELATTRLGTECLLLGLLRETSGLGGKILRERGVAYEQVRADVRAQLDAKS